MKRLLTFFVLTAALTFVSWAVLGWLVERLASWLPEAAPLLEEMRRYTWMVGAALGMLIASVLV
jgi:hypothetical protein